MDDYHGTKVADPYRWLEDETSPETAAWVEAQNAVTFPYLERIPNREALRARVMELNDYERYGAPARKGPYFFFSKNEGLQNQSVVHIQRGLEGAPEVLLDPNSWSAGRHGAARGVRAVERREVRRLRHLAERLRLAAVQSAWSSRRSARSTDNVEWAKVSQVAWHGDGFYYSRYPEPPEGHEKASINENHQVFFHKLGTPQAADTLVFEDPANPQRFHTTSTTEDERFLILEVSDRGKGLDGNALYVRDLADADGKFAPLVPEITNDTFYVVDNVGDQLLVATNHGAPNWRVVLIDPANIAEANWKTILAERPEPIDSVTTAGGKLFATYLKDVATRAYVYSLDGTLENEIALPGARHGRRLRRAERFAVRVLHVQLAQRAADDLSLRRGDAREQRLPCAERAGLRRGASSRRSRCSIRARTARRFRCSSSTARACSSTATTRRCSTVTAASTSS